MYGLYIRRWCRSALLLMATFAIPISTQAQISLDASVLDFGTCSGDTILKTFVITNIGSALVDVTVNEPDDPFLILDSDANLSLGLLETETITVGYVGNANANSVLVDSGEIVVSYTTKGPLSLSGDVTLGLRAECPDGGTGTGSNDSISISTHTIDFGDVEIGERISTEITIHNGSSVDADISVGALDPPYIIVSGGGNVTIGPNESHDITVVVEPTSSGDKDATLQIAIQAGDDAQETIDIEIHTTATTKNGGGSSDSIFISSRMIEFGNVGVGDRATGVITIVNGGSVDAEISVGTLSPPYDVGAGGGTVTIGPNESHDIEIIVRPTATGSFEATLPIEIDAGGDRETVVVDLHATGTRTGGDADVLVVNRANVDFGSAPVNTEVIRSVRLTNTDVSGSIIIDGMIDGALGNAFTVMNGGGAFRIKPGQSHTIQVRFSPGSIGAFSDSVIVDFEAETNEGAVYDGHLTIRLAGSGTQVSEDDPLLVFSDTEILFNDGEPVRIGTSVEETITLSNPGSEPLSLRFVVPEAPFDIVNLGDTTTLLPGETRNVVVRFAPTTAAYYTGTMLVVYGGDQSQSVALIGIADDGLSGVISRFDGTDARLEAPVPNPVRDVSTLTLHTAQSAQVTVVLYNPVGERISTLLDEEVPAGSHMVELDASLLEPGIYFCTMTVDGRELTRVVNVLR